jgi:phage terminase Nu1 subunit (DNA packaging protein)
MKPKAQWTVWRAASEFGTTRETLIRALRERGHVIKKGARFTTIEVHGALAGDLKAERVRKTRAEADLLELERRKETGDLIDFETAKAVLIEPCRAIAAAIKDMGARLCGKCNPSDPPLAREVIDQHCREVCAAIQERFGP